MDDIVDNKLEFRSYYKMPAPQVEQENCVAHNGSIIPVPGRDILVQAWYQGGVSIVDFTDSTNPVEIAYFDRGPIDAEELVVGGYWSTYWYDGRIYGTEIFRGLDVFELLPSEYLTDNEIAAAAVAQQGNIFNPQTQYRVDWPAVPVVARAYLDQLARLVEEESVEPERCLEHLVEVVSLGLPWAHSYRQHDKIRREAPRRLASSMFSSTTSPCRSMLAPRSTDPKSTVSGAPCTCRVVTRASVSSSARRAKPSAAAATSPSASAIAGSPSKK